MPNLPAVALVYTQYQPSAPLHESSAQASVAGSGVVSGLNYTSRLETQFLQQTFLDTVEEPLDHSRR